MELRNMFTNKILYYIIFIWVFRNQKISPFFFPFSGGLHTLEVACCDVRRDTNNKMSAQVGLCKNGNFNLRTHFRLPCHPVTANSSAKMDIPKAKPPTLGKMFATVLRGNHSKGSHLNDFFKMTYRMKIHIFKI